MNDSNAQIPLIESTEVIVVPHAPAPAAELFIVVAYSEYWTIPSQARGPWNNYEAAANAARNLASCWTHRLVVKISIPEKL